MFAKVLFAIVASACIGAGLLALRHQRLHMQHEMAGLHQQIDQARKQTWDLQTRIATAASPEALARAIERTGIELEPLAPGDLDQPGPPARPARRDHGADRLVSGIPR